MISVITFNLNSTKPMYTHEKVDFEFIEKLVGNLFPALSVSRGSDDEADWLMIEGVIVASQYHGFPMEFESQMLSVTHCQEISL